MYKDDAESRGGGFPESGNFSCCRADHLSTGHAAMHYSICDVTAPHLSDGACLSLNAGFMFVRRPSSNLFDESVVVSGGARPTDVMKLTNGPQFEDTRNDLLRLRGHENCLHGIPAVDLIPCQVEWRTERKKSSPLANSSIIDGYASERLGHVRLRKADREEKRAVLLQMR